MSKSNTTTPKNEKKNSKTAKVNEPEKIKEDSKNLKRKKSIIVEEDEPKEPPKPIAQHIFLYMHLNRIQNLPQRDHDVVLRIEHVKNTLSKLEDHYTKNTDINLSQENATMPTFSLMIDQDSMEDINTFSDNPLILTLYEYIPIPTHDEEEEEEEQEEGLLDGEEEEQEEQWIPLAQGHIDLLQFFGQKRNFHTINVFVYPLARSHDTTMLVTCKLTWQIYSILPLIKELSMSNMVFITLESIYNAKPELSDGLGLDLDLVVDLSFQSKVPNEEREYEKMKICSFSCFTKEIIGNQNSNQTWENAKSKEINNLNTLGIQFGCKLRIYKLLENLLCTEGAEFRLNEISLEHDYALVCNSVHRYVLNQQLGAILEEVVAFNQQHLLLELHRSDQPDEILLQGTVDLSIFAYPRVNVCRFGIELRPPPNAKPKQEDSTGKTTSKASKSKSINKSLTGGSVMGRSSRSNEKTTFAIMNICMLTPLTESMDSMSTQVSSPVKRDKLRACSKMNTDSGRTPQTDLMEETYKAYDEMISYLIQYIVQRNIQNSSDAKNFLCCQLGNKVNKMVKLIASDFNKRFPTKNNIEFTKLMTTVYKELVQRQYDILKNCIHPNQETFVIPCLESTERLIYEMNMTKFLFEAGNESMGSFLFDKIKAKNPHCVELSFYTFIYDMEKLDYEAAKKYIEKPLMERDTDGEYFANIIQLYINYMESLQGDQTFNEPYEELLKNVKNFADRYPKQLDFWVLLYCLYKKSRYLPGMSFARWRYENLFRRQQSKQLPTIPKSRWQIFNDCKLSVKTSKGIHFNQVLELFLRLGVYKFAEFVYNEIATECTEPEKYFMVSTFKILQKELEKKYPARQFATEKMIQGDEIKALQYQVNGNLDFYRDDLDAAMRNYSKIIDIKSLSSFDSYQLGLLRYGYYMAEQENYEQAIGAFERCCSVNGNSFIAYISIGRSLYKLGRLEDAENFFAESTKFQIHIPDVWGYLALINLKMGNNFKALEFWKYAKLNPDNVISEEILAELRAINYSDINLYVDKP